MSIFTKSLLKVTHCSFPLLGLDLSVKELVPDFVADAEALFTMLVVMLRVVQLHHLEIGAFGRVSMMDVVMSQVIHEVTDGEANHPGRQHVLRQ